jgi:hypothetical protein
MRFAMQANQTYLIEGKLPFRTAATTTGLGLNATVPAGATLYFQHRAQTSASASETRLGGVASSAVAAANTNYMDELTAIVVVGGTAGNFQLRLASEVASSTVTLKAGGMMSCRRLRNKTPSASLTIQTDAALGASYSSSEANSGGGSATARVWIEVKSNGTWAIDKGAGDTLTGTPLSGSWGTPTTSGAGTDYECKFTVGSTTGSPSITNGASGWTRVDVSRYFTVDISAANGQSNSGAVGVTVEVRKINTTTPVSTDTTTLSVSASADSGA